MNLDATLASLASRFAASAGRHLAQRPEPISFPRGARNTAVAAVLFAITLTASAALAQTGFYVSGRSLKDANGNNLYPRGVTNLHIWLKSGSASRLY